MHSFTITLDLMRLVNVPITIMMGGAIAVLLRSIASKHTSARQAAIPNDEPLTVLTKLCLVIVLLTIPITAIACNLFDYAVSGDHLMAPGMLAWAGTFLAAPTAMRIISKVGLSGNLPQTPNSLAHA